MAGSPAIDTGWPGSPLDPDGTPADVGPFFFDQANVGVPAHPVAAGLALSAAPNPLARGGLVSFRLRVAGTPGAVTLVIHDARGRRVATLGPGARSGDIVDVHWDGQGDDGLNAPPGVYFARATVGAQVVGSRIVLLD